MLAAFYRSLGSRDARKLGRVLHHVLRHHFERHFLFTMQWLDYKVYSGELYDSSFGGLVIVILLFVGIFCVAKRLATLLYYKCKTAIA